MASKKRGRERLVNCDSCGSRVPRDKAVSLMRTTVYSTDLRTADDVRTMISREFHYCPSCGKHKRIYEKKKRMAARARERRNGPASGHNYKKPYFGAGYGNTQNRGSSQSGAAPSGSQQSTSPQQGASQPQSGQSQ